MPALPADPFNQILAVRLDNIGDVVMTGPALRGLRQAYPEARITLMASPAGSQVAPLLPWIDDCIPWRAVWQDIGENLPVEPEKERELTQLLAQHQFDAAFIFTSFSQSPYPPAYACYLAGIPVRAGQSREFGGALLSHWIKPLPDETYQVERNLHLLRAAGIPVQEEHLELSVPLMDQKRADALLAACGIDEHQPFLALAPGASAAARRYDEARFAEAVQILVDSADLPVVLIGSPREAGKFPLLETLADQHTRIHSLIGQTSVPEMAAVIRRAALLLGNNSGSMHIAAALQRPMVILFSGTEVLEQWAPRTREALLLNRATACAPCHGFQCPYQMECLDIPAREVAENVINLLKTGPSSIPFASRFYEGPIRR